MRSLIVGTVRIDRDLCQGHGRCYAMSPDLFEADEVGTGLVTQAELGAEDLTEAKRAVDACPEHAVAIESHS